MSKDEWFGEPHTLIVRSVTEPLGKFDAGDMDYDLEHPPSCKQETVGEGEHSYTEYTCDVAFDERECGLAYSLRYSGTPITEPGTYRIQKWDRKIPVWDSISGYEYDGGVGVMEPEAAS